MRTRLIHTTPPTVLRVAESDTPHHPISHVLYLYPSIPSIPTRIALTSRLAEKNHDQLMTFSFARAHALLFFLLVYTLSYSLHIFRTLRLRLCLHFAFSGRNLSRSSSRPVSSSFSFSVLVAPRIGAHTPPLHGRNLLLLLSSTSERHNRTIPRVARPAARSSHPSRVSLSYNVHTLARVPRSLSNSSSHSLSGTRVRFPIVSRLPFPPPPLHLPSVSPWPPG